MVRVGRAFKHKIVPLLAQQLKLLHQSALMQRSGRHHTIIKPLIEKIGEDYDVIAHVTLTAILDGVGRGVTMSTPLTSALREIGEKVDHEAFLRLVEQKDPNGWERVNRWVLSSKVAGYHKRIKRAKRLTDITNEYTFLDQEDCVKFGGWCWDALNSICNWFDKILWVTGSGKQRKNQYYLGLSEEGVRYRDLLQAAADEACFEAWPMLVPPLQWDEEDGSHGGYLQLHPGNVSKLIHNNRGSKPSKDALEALHKMQQVPFRINPFIYAIEKQLLAKSVEIGSFKTYEADSWEDQHKPYIDPAIWETKYDHNC
jgi:hypothetical protein